MQAFALGPLLLLLAFGPVRAAEWRVEIIPARGPVKAIEPLETEVRILIGDAWYHVAADVARLETAAAPSQPMLPPDALPDSRVAIGSGAIARVWLADPTRRYRHGVLGDDIEAGSLVIEHRDGRRATLKLGSDAVFEDLEPRIFNLDGSQKIIVVKSYLERGSALAVVDPDNATILAESPPIGHSNAWINPAGIADFDGDGTTDIAVVRQPHVLGKLELWSWSNGALKKTAEIDNVSNHFIGSHALHMSATADFDGDGLLDLAVPSLNRRVLRLISFATTPHDIASVTLPDRIVTNFGMIRFRGHLAIAVGLQDGRLAFVHN